MTQIPFLNLPSILPIFFTFLPFAFSKESSDKNQESIKLPPPKFTGELSVEKAILKRKSVREYKDESLTLREISQLLWSAQGIKGTIGFRTVPSAGALYPLEIYLLAGNVKDLPAGIYKYKTDTHELTLILKGDKRTDLCNASLGQECVKDGAVVIIISAVYERTTKKYGQRGLRYVLNEVGHTAQNIYLQATSLNLGTVLVGAFIDDKVKKILNLPDNEEPLGIMPIGKIR